MFGYNYLGPYWSDGRIQPSVAYGKSRPKNDLDDAARIHDTRYAMYSGDSHALAAADNEFYERVNAMGGLLPTVAGIAVKYGNRLVRGMPRKHPNEYHDYRRDFQLDDNKHMAGLLAGLVTAGIGNIALSNNLLPKPKLRGNTLTPLVIPEYVPSGVPTYNAPRGSLRGAVHDVDGTTAYATSSDCSKLDQCYSNDLLPKSDPINIVQSASGGVMPATYAKNGKLLTGFKHGDTNVRDTWSLDIGGHNVRLTRKEYDRQVANQLMRAKTSNTQRRKRKNNKVHIGL